MAAIPESPSDARLVRDALADQDAFAHIITRYERPLRRYVSSLGMPDPERVSDLLQEVFIKAYTHLNDYDPTLSLRAWLYRIARNAVIDDMRRQSHRPHAFAREEDTEIFERVADDLDIEQEAYARDDGRAVREAVRLLDVRYRDAIVLRFFEEKSYREMSDIMRMPEGTVAAYIYRAKRELRAALKRYYEST